jgi:long-chain fatty acid transport protein
VQLLLRISFGVAASLIVLSALGQNNDELNAGVEFNFSNPGARSLAMAGAFTALGDDATAAYANPAGLMILLKPEVAGEFRRFTFATPYVDRGHPIGDVTNRGLDVISNLQSRATNTDANALSFLSFSYPAPRWAFAVYRHQLARFRTKVNSTAIFVTDRTGFVNRLFPTEGELGIDVVNYGASVATKVGPNLLVGFGFSYYLGSLDGVQRRYTHGIPGNGGTGIGEDFGPPLYSDSNLINYTVERGNDSAVGFNAGLIYKPSEHWSLGAVYRRGPSFDVQAARYFVRADRSSLLFKSATSPLHIPDVFGAGLSMRPFAGFVVAVDIDHVRYSQLVRDIADLQTGSQIPDPQYLKYVVNDAIEFRLGGEYLIRRSVPIALRLGAWRDPDHRIRYQASPTNVSDEQLFSSIAFQKGKDRIHIAGGAGIVFTNIGQIDLGVDVSSDTRTVSLSFVRRFEQ